MPRLSWVSMLLTFTLNFSSICCLSTWTWHFLPESSSLRRLSSPHFLPQCLKASEMPGTNQDNQGRLPGGSTAGVGSKRPHRLLCPRAEQRASRTLGARREENVEKGRMLQGQADREQSSMPWGCLVGALLRLQSACDSDVEGVHSCSVSLRVNPPLSGIEKPTTQAPGFNP